MQLSVSNQGRRSHRGNCPLCPNIAGATGCSFCQNCTLKFVHYSQKLEFRTIFKQCLKMRYSLYVNIMAVFTFRYPKYQGRRNQGGPGPPSLRGKIFRCPFFEKCPPKPAPPNFYKLPTPLQNIEFYSKTIYIFMILLEYDKLSTHNNQALQERKMK